MTPMNHDDERRSSTEDILAGVRADEQPQTRERPVYPGEATAVPEGEAATPEGERAAPEGEAATPEGETAVPEGETAGTDSGGGTTGRAAESELPSDGEGERHEREALLPPGEADELRSRWQEVQTRFVDDPREAVRDADALVADLMRRLAEYFAGRKHGLESQWNRDGEADTEELRVALKQYRAFFDRLLSS
ncbi:hypothetical protein PUR71_29970 [Streptomyces sp. SP17BM10]|uniref:hypothetical protein n=1 Tax=Streptomyces sp. SP17BM10 TaxID=3002530 RepID=UPI002E78DD58|nr:hypothetical protein [Streptomyces sp. SP17BM10]MEE1787102.1 hypothetical protein [Streptomyces sp. SP17BM10]